MTLGALANIQAGSWLKVRASTPGATAGSFDVPLGLSLDVGLEGKGYSSTRLALTKEFDRLDPTGREGCLFLSLVSQGAELRVCVPLGGLWSLAQMSRSLRARAAGAAALSAFRTASGFTIWTQLDPSRQASSSNKCTAFFSVVPLTASHVT